MEIISKKECTGNFVQGKGKNKIIQDPISLDDLVPNILSITKIGNMCYNDTSILGFFVGKDTEMDPFKFHETHTHVYANIAVQLNLFKYPHSGTEFSVSEITKIHEKLSDFKSRRFTQANENDYIAKILTFNLNRGHNVPFIYYMMIHPETRGDDPDLGGSRKSKKRKGKPYKKSRKSKRKR